MGLLSEIMDFALLGILFVKIWFVYTFVGDIKLNSEQHLLYKRQKQILFEDKKNPHQDTGWLMY